MILFEFLSRWRKNFCPLAKVRHSKLFELLTNIQKKKKVTSDPKFLFLKIITPNNQSSKFILKTILKDVNPS